MKDFNEFKKDMKQALGKVSDEKSYDEFRETTTAASAGIPQDTKNMKPKKYQVLTRNYIEILGKRKKAIKDSKYK